MRVLEKFQYSWNLACRRRHQGRRDATPAPPPATTRRRLLDALLAEALEPVEDRELEAAE
jgi:hypothetical protein